MELTIDSLMEVGLGQMKMSYEEFWFCEPRVFFNKLKGFQDYEKAKEEQEWMRSNYMAYVILINNPYIDKKDKPKSFKAFLSKKSKKTNKKITAEKFFAWKKKAEKNGKLTKEEFQKFLKNGK